MSVLSFEEFLIVMWFCSSNICWNPSHPASWPGQPWTRVADGHASATLTLESTCPVCFASLPAADTGPAAREPCAFVPSVAAQFAGEDPVVALEAALQFEDTRESMHAFCVGQYLEVSRVRYARGCGGDPSVCHQDK